MLDDLFFSGAFFLLCVFFLFNLLRFDGDLGLEFSNFTLESVAVFDESSSVSGSSSGGESAGLGGRLSLDGELVAPLGNNLSPLSVNSLNGDSLSLDLHFLEFIGFFNRVNSTLSSGGDLIKSFT